MPSLTLAVITLSLIVISVSYWRSSHPSTRAFGIGAAAVVATRAEPGASRCAGLEGILPRAEKALRGLQELGRAGKTIANYAEGLSAFCDWCVQRGYLAGDPLKGLAPFDTTPKVQRRAMTPEEIKALLAVAPPLLYVHSQPARALGPDLKAAGFPPRQVDFHACESPKSISC